MSLLVAVTALGCNSSRTSETPAEAVESALTAVACTSHAIQVTDLHADFRDIWKHLEVPETGKQASPNASVVLDFNTAVQASSVSGSFTPLVTDGSCGGVIPTALASSIIASNIWGAASSTDASRNAQPAPLNVLVRESISGIVSSGGAIAAGGNITLTGMSVNGSVRQPVGLMAGGKVTVTNGSVIGDLTYGVPSMIPPTVSVSGQKSQKPFLVEDAFQSLAEVANLVASESAGGAARFSNGNLVLTGTNAGVNVFRVAASVLQQAFSVQISVPVGAAAIVDVTGGNVQIQNKGISVQGATPATVLWNFAHASTLGISSVSIPGAILAPQAAVTFASGNINGILVARRFSSTGSGSLQYTALNAPLLFGTITATSVTLMPSQPLVRGCPYRFSIPDTLALSSGAGCLDVPLNVTFRVARDRLAPSDRELTDTQLDPSNHTLRRFIARAGINGTIAEALARFEGAIGISVADLVPGAPKPSFISRTQLVTAYGQVAQGYPVSGYGYLVSSEGGLFRSAVGNVMPNLPLFPAPSVTSANALANMLSSLKITQPPWVTKPTIYHAPTGILTVMPTKEFPAPSDFKLVWSFRLGRNAGIADPESVQVDASNGSVVGRDTGVERVVTLLDPKATYQQQQPATVESIFNGSQPFSVAQYKKLDNSLVTTLATGAVNALGVMATGNDPTGAGYPNGGILDFIIDPTPATPWSAGTELTETRMASAQWALEGANTFMGQLGLTLGGTSWSTIDGGVGKQQVLLNYTEHAQNKAQPGGAYVPGASNDSVANIFFNVDASNLRIDPISVSHEYAHALVHSMRRAIGVDSTLGGYRETAAINEGLADLFALASNQNHNLFVPWYCVFAGQTSGSGIQCLENVAAPQSSVFTLNGISGQPDSYKGLFYEDFSASPDSACVDTNDSCGAHLNSTIVSHWGFLLAAGSAGLPNGLTAPCGLTVPPLDADLGTSLKIALNIALRAATMTGLGTTRDAEATFASYRDATVLAARQLETENLFPGHANLAETVNLAWDAVALPSDSSASTEVTPADDLDGVDPWVTFMWPQSGKGQQAASWDLELATSPTFDTLTVKFPPDINNPTPITNTIQRNGQTMAVLKLALPIDAVSPYYWRVRPHTTGPWLGCYPIHSFTSTGTRPAVKTLEILDTIINSGSPVLVRPGSISTQWSNVPGVEEYQIEAVATTTDPHCEPVTGALSDEKVFDPNCNESNGCLPQQVLPRTGPPWLSPNGHYWLGVRPVGPADLDNNPSVGACTSLPFDTGDMRAPDFDLNDQPIPGTILPDGLNGPPSLGVPTFEWNVHDGAVQSEIRFFDVDENGECVPTQSPPPQTVETPCGECAATVNGDFLPKPPNPAGYCFEITGIAADGTRSPPTDLRMFQYEHVIPEELAPGVHLSLAAIGSNNDADPAPLPGDSYGSAVTFSWTADPSASEYMFRLNRWEGARDRTVSIEPSNCTLLHSGLGPGICDTPIETILKQKVKGTTLPVPASDGSGACTGAACGRYCWTVWPLFEDASGAESVRNPLLALDPLCYTSGPSTPVIFIDSPADLKTDTRQKNVVQQKIFTGEPITGHLHYDYVPEALGFIHKSNDQDIALGDGCAVTTNPRDPYPDVYNCDIGFTLTPQPAQTYAITTQVSAAPKHPGPPAVVHDIPLSIEIPACGHSQEGCCIEGTACTDARTFCFKDGVSSGFPPTCFACGGNGNACCPPDKGSPCDPGVTKLVSGSVCACASCGEVGTKCCAGDACDENVAVCNTNHQCVAKTACGPTPPAPPAPPVPPLLLQGVAGCTNIEDLQARGQCIVAGGPVSDLCQYFINQVALGVGWPVVPGAVKYRVTQIGLASINSFILDGSTAQNGQMSTLLLPTLPPIVSPPACDFNGYFVAISSIDDCGKESTAALTGVATP